MLSLSIYSSRHTILLENNVYTSWGNPNPKKATNPHAAAEVLWGLGLIRFLTDYTYARAGWESVLSCIMKSNSQRASR